MPGRGVPGQCRDRCGDQRAGGPEPLVETGLARDAGEHATQMQACVADPPGFRGKAQQLLGHGQAEQLRVRQSRPPPGPPAAGHAQIRQDLIGEKNVECCQESV